MKFKKAAIVMTIVPAMFIAGCSQPTQNAQITEEQKVAEVANTLNESYAKAKSEGYTGTYEDWVALLELHKTDPQQAAQQAANSGFNGMEMLMAGAMGMMLGNMLANNSVSNYRNSNYYRDDRKSYSSGYVPSARSYSSTSSTTRSTSAKSTSTSTSRGGFGGAVSSGG